MSAAVVAFDQKGYDELWSDYTDGTPQPRIDLSQNVVALFLEFGPKCNTINAIRVERDGRLRPHRYAPYPGFSADVCTFKSQANNVHLISILRKALPAGEIWAE
jgi:hypothetical protein